MAICLTESIVSLRRRAASNRSFQEDVLAPFSPAHDVLHGTGILDAQLARHGSIVSAHSELVKSDYKYRGLTLSTFEGLGEAGPVG